MEIERFRREILLHILLNLCDSIPNGMELVQICGIQGHRLVEYSLDVEGRSDGRSGVTHARGPRQEWRDSETAGVCEGPKKPVQYVRHQGSHCKSHAVRQRHRVPCNHHRRLLNLISFHFY